MEDTSNKSTQISSDDQELAKVLAGVDPNAAEEPEEEPEPEQEAPAEEEPAGPNLSSVRDQALQDIKPLLDKLDVPADEKFDIYMEVLRVSNDQALIEPAYNVTTGISDETKRANDLLTVIKTIDTLSPPTE
jgi:hypothetical protein